ncbi:orotidine-5'-phosphate decarboxylase [Legionella longbeachae]|uniref:Orotidine 5'-phosphate decarboxylase n=1 Tax=Legionella longbeachae serogroup 1 (strain NSW150) TaxID=661367 RepID=D3HTC9_LEGLN|nr:orotidine-5'-phosphate decarboxylase [Legionella longbeachae]VEE02662.1 orotidine 5`-phosphate decarboxylase [Legionella oakridgensis]HBD7397924.1 orotidine-5'-phosphate decarboxylase [Legionella pneumophila]ARB91072.1 orotidine-5'-phosphate decarboxylase [Legionella longbeachae]EEZ94685.1 orotidine 5'-phosphate decarboxylase [Legionella longbeachae D-4968]QIN32496.1 orotidine-5'-phosphate decarboxylase [Legionella longbeachae]
MSSKLIVALDFHTEDEALSLIEKLDPQQCALKVGNELFTLFGTQFVKRLILRQFKVFLDLKFHDIPNTVSQACKAAADLGVWMMNVHAAGGASMMHAARDAIESYGAARPLLIAVTVLTSFNQNELSAIGINIPIIEQVKKLAVLAKESGLDGVVCSAQEVKVIKSICGTQFLTVTPGIRLETSPKDDQSRVMTPKQAMETGSNYLVIGRPITKASDPQRVISEIIKDIT